MIVMFNLASISTEQQRWKIYIRCFCDSKSMRKGFIFAIIEHNRKELTKTTGPPGNYISPAYLKDAAVGPEQGSRIEMPASTPNTSESVQPAGKLGSIAPTPIAFKRDQRSPAAVSLITACPLCNGLVKDGECGTCGGKQCPSCGEMNFATATTCLGCKQSL